MKINIVLLFFAMAINSGIEKPDYKVVKKYNNFVQFNNPDYEIKNNFSTQNTHAGNFLPVYPSLEGIPQRTMRNTIRKSLDNGSNLINDFIPDEILKRNNFFPLKKAFENMHFPLTIEEQKSQIEG